MKKCLFFLILSINSFLLSQVLAPAADGHILRNQTFVFNQSNPQMTYGGNTTYFVYFQDLYVGGEDTFTADFDPNDGKATHYNRELRTILEFDISALNLSPGNFSAYLKVTTDGNFWPTEPYLMVEAWDQSPSQQDGTITLNDYDSQVNLLETQQINGSNFGITYSFNVTDAVNNDILNSRDFSGFVLIPNPRNGNEISFVSSWEEQNQGKTGMPKLEFTPTAPDINVQYPSYCDTVVGTQYFINVRVKNTGQGVLNINSITKQIDTENVFSLDLSGFNYNLNPQEESVFKIIFSPSSEGYFYGSFRIISNDPDENPYDFSLGCNATPSAVPSMEVILPQCQNIPTFSSTPLEVKIRNNGSAVLEIYDVTELIDTSDVFTIDLSGFSKKIQPQAESSFHIIFNPQSPGNYSGKFRISSNDPVNSLFIFDLICTAVSSTEPDISVSPEEMLFYNVRTGEEKSKIVIIRNNSTNPDGNLKISSILISGDEVFSIDTSELKLTIKPGEQTSFKVKILSSKTGVFKGLVSINSNDPDTPSARVSLIGSVTLNGLSFNSVPSSGYIIPASALAYGAFGSRWVTDLKITNPLNKDISFRMYFLPTQTDNSNAISGDFVLGSFNTLSIPNILNTLFGMTEGIGAILISPFEELSELLIISRTYNLTENGTYGQFIKGYPLTGFLGKDEKSYLLGLQKDVRMRTNVGFNSLYEGAKLKLSLYNGNGEFLASKEINLKVNSHYQINDIFNELNVQGHSNSYAVIEVSSGKVFSYASVVNNQSSDPVFVPMQ